VIEDAEKQNKISELYDLVHQSESMAEALPEVVDRLEALQGLHNQGQNKLRILSLWQKLNFTLSLLAYFIESGWMLGGWKILA